MSDHWQRVPHGTPNSIVGFDLAGEESAWVLQPNVDTDKPVLENKVEVTLAERDKRYGGFENNATIAQTIKEIMRGEGNWAALEDDQREALEMIASKIGRMLSGDPNYIDNWHDIAGYATLVEQRLNKRSK